MRTYCFPILVSLAKPISSVIRQRPCLRSPNLTPSSWKGRSASRNRRGSFMRSSSTSLSEAICASISNSMACSIRYILHNNASQLLQALQHQLIVHKFKDRRNMPALTLCCGEWYSKGITASNSSL